MKKNPALFLFIFCFMFDLQAQHAFKINEFSAGKDFSIRGISMADPKTVWISGSNGSVGISKDSGCTFTFNEIKGYSKLDFRDIEALNDSEAIIINAGSPAYILKTNNAGKGWKEVYQNKTKEIFFNGFDFWDKQHGIAFSDPVADKLFILTTHDGGESWQVPDSLNIPECFKGEGGFAASGTSIFCGQNGKVIIGTGGSHARVFISNDFGINWHVIETPMMSGKESSGIFSTWLTEDGIIYIIGGDYKADSLDHSAYYITDDEGLSWMAADLHPAGYRSCIIAVDGMMLTTGSNGTDYSDDRGMTWRNIDHKGFNSIGYCEECGYVLLVGNHGKIARLKSAF